MSPARVNEELVSRSESEIIDLPALRTKPSYNTLLKALQDLELPPTTWNGVSAQISTIEAKLESQYLLSIVSSDLNWLEKPNEKSVVLSDQRDELWELASKRLAERCGRSAMPEMTRTWTVPSSISLPELKFDIREPPLTGDNLGLKTWGTAFAIVKKLEGLGGKYFSHLLNPENRKSETTAPDYKPGVRVLELGSGTGLVGIASAAIWKTEVILTDLPEIKENLQFNIHQNIETVESMGGSIRGEVLDWKDPSGFGLCNSTEFEIVIAADPLYDDEHPQLVAQNIKRYLKHHESSRAIVAIPMRDNHTRSMAEEFKKLMEEQSLELLHHGQETCHDDWAENVNEEAVKCWWGIWTPKCAP